MIRTAVMVGEMSATDWASTAGKPSAFARSPGRVFGGPEGTPVVNIFIVLSAPSNVVGEGVR